MENTDGLARGIEGHGANRIAARLLDGDHYIVGFTHTHQQTVDLHRLHGGTVGVGYGQAVAIDHEPKDG